MNENYLVNKIASAANCRVLVKAELNDNIPIYVIWNDSVGRSILQTGYYDPDTVRVLKNLLKAGSDFIDVGAHVGQFTLIAAKAGCRVHGFEPDPLTFDILQKNVHMNNAPNVRLNRSAVSSETGKAAFFTGNVENIGAGSLRRQKDSTGEPFSVKCTTLDEYVKLLGIQSISLIKIDVEGAELDVLRGARQTLNHLHPPIVLEFNADALSGFGATPDEIERELRSRNYALYRVTPNGPIHYVAREPEDFFFNVLALPPGFGPKPDASG